MNVLFKVSAILFIAIQVFGFSFTRSEVAKQEVSILMVLLFVAVAGATQLGLWLVTKDKWKRKKVITGLLMLPFTALVLLALIQFTYAHHETMLQDFWWWFPYAYGVVIYGLAYKELIFSQNEKAKT